MDLEVVALVSCMRRPRRDAPRHGNGGRCSSEAHGVVWSPSRLASPRQRSRVERQPTTEPVQRTSPRARQLVLCDSPTGIHYHLDESGKPRMTSQAGRESRSGAGAGTLEQARELEEHRRLPASGLQCRTVSDASSKRYLDDAGARIAKTPTLDVIVVAIATDGTLPESARSPTISRAPRCDRAGDA